MTSASGRFGARPSRRRAPLFFLAVALVGGCAQVLGLESWQDPVSAGGGGSTTSDAGHGGHEPVDPDNPTCADGVKNGLETDVDCGGDACPPCDNGRHCNNDADCSGHGCVAGRCETSDGGPCVAEIDPTCHDCEKNSFETDVDCGGETCLPCSVGKHCKLDGDCMSTRCRSGRCAAGASGEACRVAGDCVSARCVTGDCFTGLCCR